jgi:hypothetical protein
MWAGKAHLNRSSSGEHGALKLSTHMHYMLRLRPFHDSAVCSIQVAMMVHDYRPLPSSAACVGRTTTDFGLVSLSEDLAGAVNISRLQSSSYLSGVRTNLPLPAVESVGLGGGSLVRLTPLAVGPTSVGAELLERCRAGGGADLTATDVAIKVRGALAGGVGLELVVVLQCADGGSGKKEASIVRSPAWMVSMKSCR